MIVYSAIILTLISIGVIKIEITKPIQTIIPLLVFSLPLWGKVFGWW